VLRGEDDLVTGAEHGGGLLGVGHLAGHEGEDESDEGGDRAVSVHGGEGNTSAPPSTSADPN
jgi:hypothetical protein